MSRKAKPLADGIDGGGGASEPKGKWVAKDDYKKRMELDEARKAGNAPAEVDIVTGKDINPHIPQVRAAEAMESIFSQTAFPAVHSVHSLVL